MIKRCLMCKQEFDSTSHKHKLCSDACRKNRLSFLNAFYEAIRRKRKEKSLFERVYIINVREITDERRTLWGQLRQLPIDVKKADLFTGADLMRIGKTDNDSSS